MISWPLRIVIGLVGAGIAVLGLDSAAGGLRTLGMQVPTNFAQVSTGAAYIIRDSHIRFLGGVWTGVGLLWIAGALQPRRLAWPILLSIGFVVLGALARLTSPDLRVMLQTSVLASLVFELIAFPLIGVFLLRQIRSQTEQSEE